MIFVSSLPLAKDAAEIAKKARDAQSKNAYSDLVKGIAKRAKEGLNAHYQSVPSEFVENKECKFCCALEELKLKGYRVTVENEGDDYKAVRVRW